MNIKSANTIFPWLLLFGRSALFLGFQMLFVFGFFITGSEGSWDMGAAWWPFAVTMTNIVILLVLISLYRSEGKSYWEIFRIAKGNFRKDILPLIGTLVIAAPVGYFPNVLLSGWLFSDAQIALDLLVRPLPLWAAYISIVLFPITQGLVEIPMYFSYLMPRLEAQGMGRWLAVSVPAVMLGLQHFAVPFVFDIRFITWRAFMYLPFAFLVGIILRWRPRLLPYLAVTHVLMDASFAMMLLGPAY